MDEAISQLENARQRQLTTESQVSLNSVKASVEAARMRLEPVSEQLNDAQSKFADAKTQMDSTTLNILTISQSSGRQYVNWRLIN